jgi:membrane-associated phospholipid phosphatase
MIHRARSFWHWPGLRQLGYSALLSVITALWFELIYSGTNIIAAQYPRRVRLHFDVELSLPFVPATVLLYLSLYLLFAAAPFILRSRRELRALAATMAAMTACAALGFLALPADSAFPAPGYMGIWTAPVHFARAVALEHNFLPSLHVALSVACVDILAGYAGVAGKVLLWLWGLAICASTMLLHQHYVADVVTGFALGLAGARWGYRRWVVQPRAVEAREANLSRGPGQQA